MKSNPFLAIVCLIALGGCVGGGSYDLGKARPDEAANQDAKIVQTYTSADRSTHAAIMKRDERMTLSLQLASEHYTSNTRWQENGKDHFAVWIEFLSRKGAAMEFIAPIDHTSPAVLQIYDQGNFVLVTQDGIQRPVPYGPFGSYPLIADPPNHGSNSK